MKTLMSVFLFVIICLAASGCAADAEPIASSGEPSATTTYERTSPTDAHSNPQSPCQPVAPADRHAPEDVVLSFDGSETLLFSSELCAAYVTYIGLNEELGRYEAGVRCENYSDRVLVFSCDTFAVNNWVYDDPWSEKVEPGTSRDSVIPFISFCPVPSMTSAGKVSLLMEVTHDDIQHCVVAEGLFTLYSQGVTEELLISPERIKNSRDVVLTDNDRFCLVLLVDEIYAEYPYSPYELTFYAENRINDFVDFDFDGFSINRWSLEPYFYHYLHPGTKGYFTVRLDPDAVTACGIEEYSEICFDLEVLSVYDYPKCYLDMLCTAFPTGLNPEDIPDPVRQTPEGSRVVLDSDELTVILEPVSFKGSTPEFCVCTRNKGDSMINVTLNQFVVNGQEDSLTGFGDTVRPGMQALSMAKLKRYESDSLNRLECVITIQTADGSEELFRCNLAVIP